MNERNVALENLKLWHEAAAENRQLRLLQITQMAKADKGHLQSEESAHNSIVPVVPFLPCPDTLPAADGFARAMALDERMTFCRTRLAPDAPPPLLGELRQAPPAPRVARLAGTVSDKAFRRLLPLLGTARPVYLSSLGELLEELAAGNADFALLPIEDAKGVRFLHFYEEFDRLELHITHVCHVLSEENEKNVGFALLSKQYRPHKRVAGEQMLEYRVSGQDRGALTELLAAAETAGLTLYRVDSLPAPYSEDGFVYHVILSASKTADAALLHTYLSLFLPRAIPVGTYIRMTTV